MSVFKKRIVISKEFHPEFLFSRIYTVNGLRYYVSVTDKAHKAHHFSMQEHNGSWQVMDGLLLPDWITGAEEALEQAIFEHLSL